MINQDSIKENYPPPSNTTYLNTSSSGLVSKNGIKKAHDFNQQLLAKGSAYVEEYYKVEIAKVRKTISSFVDASVDETALVPNFSYALSAVIPSLSRLKRVLLYKSDYPSLTIPFELHNFEITWIDAIDGFRIDLNEIESLIIDHKIDIIAISHVQYLTGFTIELDKLQFICKKYDILLIIDATQSLGAFPFSFKSSGINILITSNYKWLNAGYGTGILCMDKETILRYPPKIGGFNSFKYTNSNWAYAPGINSYEPGHFNIAGLAMLQEAIEYKMLIGIENIGIHNFQLLQMFTDAVKSSMVKIVGPKENKNRKNIIGIKGTPRLEKNLLEQGIIVKLRENILRIGIHFYNTREDIMRLLNALESFDFKNQV